MSRYVIRPRDHGADEWYDEPYVEPLGHPRVYDRGPVKTGLVDANGNDIYRLPDAIGFVRKRDA